MVCFFFNDFFLKFVKSNFFDDLLTLLSYKILIY